ncbi:MAG: VWA domain-containing protein [Victivallaceae bacterium]
MIFAYPWLLLLFLLLGLLVWYIWNKKPMPAIVASTAKPFKAANGMRYHRVSRLPLLLYTLAAGLLVLALARPREGIEKVVVRAKGIDIILAIDLSGSMQAIDVPEKITTASQLKKAIDSGAVKNRLEVAKQEIAKFIEKRPNDRIGLIGFAPMAYNICPPTLDHAWLLANLSRLEPGVIGDRTGIASPIASGVHRLEKSDSKRRVLVLFTDGSNNVDARITPRQAAKLAKTCNVVVYTVGIGSGNAFVLQNSFDGPQFVPIRGEFDEPLLQDIASVSDGKYYRAYDAEGLEKVMGEINKLEKTSIEQPKFIDYKEFAPVLAALALALFLLGFLAENTFHLSVP